MLHKFADLNRIMILVSTVDGQTYGTDQTSIFAVAVDTHEGGILSM